MEDVGAVAHRSQVLLVEQALGAHRRPEQRHQPLDQLGLEPGQLGRLIPGVLALRNLEEVLRVAEREPAARAASRTASTE